MPETATSISSKVHYLKMGSGPALALLHGFPESCEIWRNVCDALSRKFTLIIPDFPGSGQSPLEQETTIAGMADCVAQILRHENIEKAVIAGHSMGGYIALGVGEQHPELVKGISIVHSTAAADDEEKKKMRQKSIDLIQKGGKSVFVRQMVPNLFTGGFKDSHPEVIEEQISRAMETSEDALVNYYRAMIGRKDQRNWLQTTSIPLQWLLGTEDNVMDYKKILSDCARSRINFVTFYNNCGHMSMFEAPEKLAKDLEIFAEYCHSN